MPDASGPAPNNTWLLNQRLRQLWLHGDPSMARPIRPALRQSQRLNPALPSNAGLGSTLTCQIRNVGLITKLWIEVAATITTAGAAGDNVALTPWGLANFFSNVTLFDFANNMRINTSGWHLIAVSSLERHRAWGSAMTTDTPYGYANTVAVNRAAATIAGSATATTVRAIFEVPLAVDDRSDLTGSMWGGVSTATATLTAVINSGMFVSNVGDPTLAVYQNAASANLPVISAISWNVLQFFMTQGPTDQQGNPLLPPLDIANIRILTNTNSVLPTVSSDNTYPFTNQRKFRSAIFGYNNAGVLNAGTDLNYVRVQSANLTNVVDYDAFMLANQDRLLLGDDMPKGMYALDFRYRPIDTDVQGNYQIVINPSSVGGATAQFLFGFDAIGQIGAVNYGGSLPSGA